MQIREPLLRHEGLGRLFEEAGADLSLEDE